MGKPDNQSPVKLEDLLRLKRDETPDEQFWVKFDQDFQSRRLQVLVNKKPSVTLLWRSITSGFAVTMTVAAVALAFMYDTGSQASHASPVDAAHVSALNPFSEPVAHDISIAEQVVAIAHKANPIRVESSNSQFVVDAIRQSDSTRIPFHKVLYSPALQLTTSPGSHYVRDSLVSGEFRVTTADARLGRNF